jgi:hypothetical protein
MLLFWMPALVVLAFQIVGHFLLDQLLYQPLYTQTDDGGCDILLSVQAQPRHLLNPLADLPTWWYSINGVSVSFLPFGRPGPYQGRIIPHAAFFFTELY